MTSLENLSSWHSDWKSQKIVVYGLGLSGFSVADTLCELGAELLVVADRIDPEHRDLLEVLGIRFVEGASEEENLREVEQFLPSLAVVSPGIKPTNYLVKWFDLNKIPTLGDIELAWRVRDKVRAAQWVLVTGTNGKTTTSQLVESMLIADGKRAIACGNIGLPVLDAVRDPEGWDFLVVEISSFQLHYLNRIAPLVSAVLNIAEDHIDWHGSYAEYQRIKGKVFDGSTKAIVYNAEDDVTRALAESADVADENVLAVSFTRGMPQDLQVGFVEEFLIDRAFYGYRAAELPELASLDDIEQIGVVTPHLLSNVAAAAAIARACDVSAESIKSAIRLFKLDRHRIEFVANRDGVLWFDDSKATNPHAADASLKSFESVIWIVGGLLKGADINDLVSHNSSRLKAAVVIGVDQTDVLTALATHAPAVKVLSVPVDSINPMKQAVILSAAEAEPGDVVLLAPAAASMDQFKDYADRGEKFSLAVRELSDEN
jgi:UDP-N-acetylmuramoylalanine--D-glutamate ligase